MKLYKNNFINSNNKDAYLIRTNKISEKYYNLNYI